MTALIVSLIVCRAVVACVGIACAAALLHDGMIWEAAVVAVLSVMVMSLLPAGLGGDDEQR